MKLVSQFNWDRIMMIWYDCFSFLWSWSLLTFQVIRNEALLLLTYLTREAEVSFWVCLNPPFFYTFIFVFFFLFAPKPCLRMFDCHTKRVLWFQEIQKIVVFEGAFEKIFSIIKEEGGSEGGVVVQVINWIYFFELQWTSSGLFAVSPFIFFIVCGLFS